MSAPASPVPAPAASGSRPSLLALTEEFRAQSERLQAFAESQSQNDLLEDAQKKDIDKMSRRFAALLDLKKMDSYDKYDEKEVRSLASHLQGRSARLTAINAEITTSLMLAFERLAWEGVIPALLDHEVACTGTSTVVRIRKMITSWESAATEAAYGLCDTYDKRTNAGEEADKAMRDQSDRFYELQGMYCDVLCRHTAQLSDMAIVGCLVVLDKASKRSLLRARRSMTPEVLGRILFALKTQPQISDWVQVIQRLSPPSSDTPKARKQYAQRFFSCLQPYDRDGMLRVFADAFLEAAEGSWCSTISDILAKLGQADPTRPNRFRFSRLIPIGRRKTIRCPKIRGEDHDAPYDAWMGADGLIIALETGSTAQPGMTTLGVALDLIKSVTSFGNSNKPSLLVETSVPLINDDVPSESISTGVRIFLPSDDLDSAVSAFELRGFKVQAAEGQQGSQSLPSDALAMPPPPQGSSSKSNSSKRKTASVRIQQLPEGVAASIAEQSGPFIGPAAQKAKASVSPMIDSEKSYQHDDDGRISSAEFGLKTPMPGRQTTASITESEEEESEGERVQPVPRRVREVGETDMRRLASTSVIEESSKSKESVWEDASLDPAASGRNYPKPNAASNSRRPDPRDNEDEAQRPQLTSDDREASQPEPSADERESTQPPAGSASGRKESAAEVSAGIQEATQPPTGSGEGEGHGSGASAEEHEAVRPPSGVAGVGESGKEVEQALPQLGRMIGATQASAASREQASRPVEPLTAPPAETPGSEEARSATTDDMPQTTQPVVEVSPRSKTDSASETQERKKAALAAPAQEKEKSASPAQAKEKAALAVPAQAKAKRSVAAPAQAKAALLASRLASSESDLSSADDAVAAAAEAPSGRAPRAAPAVRAKAVPAEATDQPTDGLPASPVARSKTRKPRSPEQIAGIHEEEAPAASFEIPAKHAVPTPYKSKKKEMEAARAKELMEAAIAAKQAKSGLGLKPSTAIAAPDVAPGPEEEEQEAEASAEESEESAPAAPATAQRPKPRPRSSAPALGQQKKRKADAPPAEAKVSRKRAKASVARAATSSPEQENDEEDVDEDAYGFGSDAAPPGGPVKQTGRKSAGSTAKKAAPKKQAPKKASPKKTSPQKASPKKPAKATAVDKPAKATTFDKPTKTAAVDKPAKKPVEKPVAPVSAGKKQAPRATSPAREQQQVALDEEQDFSDGPPAIDSRPASDAGDVNEQAPERMQRNADRHAAPRPSRSTARAERSEADAEGPLDEAAPAPAAPLGVNNGNLLGVPRKLAGRSSSGSEKASRASWMSKPNAAASAKRARDREALEALAKQPVKEPVRPEAVEAVEEPVLDGPSSDYGPPDIIPDGISATSAAARSQSGLALLDQYINMDQVDESDQMQRDDDDGRLLQLPAASDVPVSPSEARAQRRSQSRSQARTSPTSRAVSVGGAANERTASTPEQQAEAEVSQADTRSLVEKAVSRHAAPAPEPAQPVHQQDMDEVPEPPMRGTRATRDVEMAPPEVPSRAVDAGPVKPPPYAPPAVEPVRQPSPPQQSLARQESITMSLERTTVSVIGSSFPDSYHAAVASALGRALGNDEADVRRVEAPAAMQQASLPARESSRDAPHPLQAPLHVRKTVVPAPAKLRGRDSGVAGMSTVIEEAPAKESPVRRQGRSLLQESDTEEPREVRSKKRASVTEEAPLREAASESPIARQVEAARELPRERVEVARKKQRVEPAEERSVSMAPVESRTPLREERPRPQPSPATRLLPASHLRASTPHASKGTTLRSAHREPSTQARSHAVRPLESRAETSSAEDALSVRQLAEAARAKRKAALQHRQTNLETTEAEARVVQQRAAEMRSAADRIMQAFTRDASGQLARRLSAAEQQVHKLCSDFASGVSEISALTARTAETLLVGVDGLERAIDALEKNKARFEESSSALERMLRHTREGRAAHEETGEAFPESLFG